MALAGITARRRVPLPPPRPGRRALRRPQRDGRRARRRRGRGRHADHAARHLLPARRHRRGAERACSGASPTATSSGWAERVGALGRRRRRRSRIGAAIHSRAGGRSRRRCRGRRRVGGRARRAAARPRHRAAGRERGLPRRLRPHPDRAARPTPALLGRAVHRGPRHPPDRRRHRGCSAAPAHVCFCPTTERDLADGIGPAARARRRRRAAVPRLRLPRGDRPVRGGAGGRAGRAAGHRRARPPPARPSCCAAATAGGTPALGWPEAGRLDAGRAGRPRDRRLDSVRPPGRRRAPTTLVEAAVFAAGAADVAPRRWSAARWSSATARTCGSTSAGELAAARSPRVLVVTHALVIDNIGLLVTNDPTLGDGPARAGPRRRASSSRTAGWWPSSAAGAAADERDRRRRALRDPRLRRQPHPPGVRRRPGRRSSRPGWPASPTRPAASASRPTRPGPPATTSCGALAAARRRPRRGAPASPTSRSSRLRPRRRRRGPAAAGSPAELTDDVTFLGAHVVPRRVRGPGRRLRRARLRRRCSTRARRTRRWIDVFCEAGAFDADQSPRRARGRPRPPGSGCGSTPTSSAPAPACSWRSSWARASADHCTYLDRRRRRRARRRATPSPRSCPATDFSTRQPYPDARRLIDAGATVALATQLQPGLELHDLDVVLHRARRARHAHDAPRRRCGRPPPAARRAAPRRRRPPLAGLRRRTPSILDAPSYHHLAYRPGVPLVAEVIAPPRHGA